MREGKLPPLTHRHLVESSLLERFDDVVAARPEATAIVAEHQRLSFRELQSWSERIAKEIEARLGDGRRPIATMLGHTPAAIAAILGIGRTGRPFMNLDPSLPDLRLQQMQSIGAAEACLGEGVALERAAQMAFDAPPIDIETSSLPDAAEPAVRVAVDGAAPACILFSSGSTGRPKGIVWPGSTLVKDALAGNQAMGFSEADRIGLVLPIPFAAGLSVVTWGLTSGAALHLLDPRQHSISDLADWIARERLTTLHTTPTLLRALVRAVMPGQEFDELRLLTTCGEPVRSGDVLAVRTRISDSCEFMNWTGSTEVGVLALHRIGPGEPVGEGLIPAGEVVEGLSVEIEPLVGDDAPDEPDGLGGGEGTTGEMIVVSDHIALGYCGEADELASRFEAADGGRRYRSGDLATVGPTGTLRLHGRRDAAIKIRGYLVEPSEAEAALLEAEEVAEAAVVAEKTESDPRLVAYVVPAAGHVLSVGRLRGQLRDRLPSYAVPRTIVQVSDMPRTERGKIDRAALEASKSVMRAEFRAPRTAWERVIVQIWERALGIDDIGVDDDFFELGGDSLAVEEVLSDLQTIGPELPTTTFISAPTVAALAAAVEDASFPSLRSGVAAIRRTGRGSPALICFAGAGGVALAFERLVRHLDAVGDAYGVQMHALEHRGIPDFSVKQAATRFLKELPRLHTHGPYVLAGHSYGGLVAYEVARRLRNAGQEVALLALIDSYPPTLASDFQDESSMSTVDRVKSEVTRFADALPGETFPRRAYKLLKMATAGPIRYRGLAHFDIFFDRGYVMQRLYRPKPYPGRTVVYAAERNELAIDHLRWERWLTGPWELAVTPGDHHTLLREPYVVDLAEDLNERLADVKAPTE